MRLQRLFILLFLPFLLVCCNKPAKELCFVELDRVNGFDAPVALKFQISDTLTPQQMDICMRLYNSDIPQNGTISIILKAISPLGNCGCDTLHLPVNQKKNNKVAYNKVNGALIINWPYRKNVIIGESGDWTFSISPYNNSSNRDIYKNITGLGISFKKENK